MRSDYLAALAESKSLKELLETRHCDVTSLEQQLARVKDTLKSTLAELDERVTKSELRAARLRCEQLEAQAAKTAAENAKALDEVNDRLRESLVANDKLMKTMQVASR